MWQCSRLSLTLWNLLRAWMFWLPDGGCQRLSKNETVIFCISKWRCIVWMMDGPCWLTGPLYARIPCVNSGTLSAASHVGLFRGSCQSSFLLPPSINQKSHWEEACHSHVTLKGTGERCGWHTQVGARKVKRQTLDSNQPLLHENHSSMCLDFDGRKRLQRSLVKNF